MSLNFLYAFDNNYNTQGCVSIYSLLENVEEQINVYVILDQSNINFAFPEIILNHKNLKNFIIKEINSDRKFYNVETSHISPATFYRLYISSLFEDEQLKLVYLDSDIICVSNPLDEIIDVFENMKKEDKTLGFADEFYRHQNDEPFRRLNMSNQKYFNAGVMFIDLETWKLKNYSKKAIELIDILKNKAQFWDQDILNSLVDGDYLTIDSNLNYRTAGVEIGKNIGDITFIHYSGKSKPWDIGGIFEEFSLIYHDFYKKLFGKTYHIISRNRKNSLIKFFNSLRHFRLIPFNKYLKFIFYSILAIFRK
tara:strand:- start:511 stop:1437 length:927 start_codon:yes stop_codon:yes gene_type:complete